MHPGTTLTDAVRKWPTPRATESEMRTYATVPSVEDGRGHGRHLQADAIEVTSRWPTPTASMATIQDMEQARFAGNDPRRPKYSEAMYPTPKAERYGSSQNGINRHGPNARPSAGTPSLDTMASHGLLPSLPDPTTPQDGSATSETSPAPSRRSLVLSPVFVETLMGYPIGWSALSPIDPRDYEVWATRFVPSRQR